MCKKIACFFLVSWLTLVVNHTYAHELNRSYFDVYQEESKTVLQGQIDKNHLFDVLKERFGDKSIINENKVLSLSFSSYIKENIRVVINDKEGVLKSLTYSFDHDTAKFTLFIENVPLEINNLYIQNTVLLNQIENQENIVRLKLNNRSRSFRLHRNRTSINVTW